MGNLCGPPLDGEFISVENKKQDGKVGKTMKIMEKQNRDVITLLLLGAGESGKSTIFKQLRSLYGTGYTDDEWRDATFTVGRNIVEAINNLVNASIMWEYDPTYAVHPQNQDSKHFILERKPTHNQRITPEMAHHIKRLWSDPGIQNTYKRRSEFQLPDSTVYFIEQRLDDVAKPEYKPLEQDMLRCRVRTTGIVETSFEVKDQKFKMMDVGGQRNERKKWVHCFEQVTGVLFVAALSGYDQLCFEDNETNRLNEGLQLFDEVSNSKWFRNSAIVLFLNKRDIFAELIKIVCLSRQFSDYDGPSNDYTASCEYIQRKFENQYHSTNKGKIYTHITCATDTDNIRYVFGVVRDHINRENLKAAGLMEY